MTSTALQERISIRQSNYELLRLIAMFLIVLYHLFLCVYTVNPDYISCAIWIPLHVGVPLFVLISGYFRINFSFKKLIRLVVTVFFYTAAIQIIALMRGEGGAKPYLVFFLSRSPYWFMPVYIMLFSISPFINRLLDILSSKEELAFIAVLSIISFYFGAIHGFTAYADGKNLLNFVLIYTIADYIKKSENRIKEIPIWRFLCAFLVLNGLEILMYVIIPNDSLKSLVWRVSFSYCGPLLIINAVFLFLIFGRLSIVSKTINWIAGTCLGIYMLHSHPYIVEKLNVIVKGITDCNTKVDTVILLFSMTFAIMSISAIIDKLVQAIISKLFNTQSIKGKV